MGRGAMGSWIGGAVVVLATAADLVARSSGGDRGSNGGCTTRHNSGGALRWDGSSHDYQAIATLTTWERACGHRESLNVRPADLYWLSSNDLEELRSWTDGSIASCP